MCWCVVHACRAATPAGCRAWITPPLLRRPKWSPCSTKKASRNLRLPAKNSCATHGNGKRNTAVSSSNNCANWVLHATGSAPASRWMTSARKASCAYSATSTKKAKSTAAYAWSIGIRLRKQPSRTRRSYSKNRTANSTICAIASRTRSNSSSSPRLVRKPFWAIRRSASTPTTNATKHCRPMLGSSCRSWAVPYRSSATNTSTSSSARAR